MDPYDLRLAVSPSEYLTGDPYDAMQDRKAELDHDGPSVEIKTRDIVRASLNLDRSHDCDRRLSNSARHPFGLPTVVAPPTPGDHPTGLRPVSPPPAGEQAGGLHLPDLAA